MLNPADTLTLDTARLNAWRVEGGYDYNQQFRHANGGWWEQVRQWWDNLFSNNSLGSSPDIPSWVWVAVMIIIAIVVGFLLVRSMRGARDEKIDSDDIAEEDNIYTINFEESLSRARREGNYFAIVRLIYLQTLRSLADNAKINWQIDKTPTQYTRELPLQPFREMTLIFLRVRYGGFKADSEMAEQMLSLQGEVLRHEAISKSTTEEKTGHEVESVANKEKGGEA